MKVKGALVSVFSKKKHISPHSKLLKQKKLKSSTGSLKKQKVEVISKEKLNLALDNTELVGKLRTKTDDTIIKEDNISKQRISQDLAGKMKIDKIRQINSMSRSIKHKKDALNKENPDLANNATKVTSKLKLKKKKDNIRNQNTTQGWEKVKNTGINKQIKPREKSLNNQEIRAPSKVEPIVDVNETKLTYKQKNIKQKEQSLKRQDTIQNSETIRKISNENITSDTECNSSSFIAKNKSKKTKSKRSKSANSKQKISGKISPKIEGSNQVAKEMAYKTAYKTHTKPDVEEICKKQLNLKKVTAAVNALYKIVKGDQTEFLNLAEPIFMEVECIKIPQCPIKQLRFKLPHSLVNELSDILLITADKKGAKIHPDKAVEHYTELLAKHDIKFIQQVIPLRTITAEYSQYELRKKLVDQYDMILADATIINSLGSRLGKHVLYKRKMPLPVQLKRKDLKQHLLMTISKTQMTVKGNGHLTSVQVGHTKMTAHEVAANILAVTQILDSVYPGGFKNIRSLDIKTSGSISLPVFYSTVPSSAVETPVEQPKQLPSVVGELSTHLHSNVVVKADGTVDVRRVPKPSMLLVDDSHDDEILRAAKEYEESAKTIHYDENEDSDGGDEAATNAMEEKLLKNYNLAKKKNEEEGGEEEEQEEEEEEESSDEEEPVPLPVGQKRKKGGDQALEKLPKKKQKKAQQGKLTESTQNKEIQKQIKKGDQKRGSRGGKKQKMNKDQRKALIKRKKAGKK